MWGRPGSGCGAPADGGAGAAPWRAFIGLGSNLGDRPASCARAVEGLAAPATWSASRRSTRPSRWAGPGARAPTSTWWWSWPPRTRPALLERCQTRGGRQRVRERWGPRTLDADVLWVEGLAVDEADLTVPHPRLWERRFVLRPLADLAPDLVTSEQLRASGGEVARVGTEATFLRSSVGERHPRGAGTPKEVGCTPSGSSVPAGPVRPSPPRVGVWAGLPRIPGRHDDLRRRRKAWTCSSSPHPTTRWPSCCGRRPQPGTTVVHCRVRSARCAGAPPPPGRRPPARPAAQRGGRRRPPPSGVTFAVAGEPLAREIVARLGGRWLR